MTGLADADGFKICIQERVLPGFRPLDLHRHVHVENASISHSSIRRQNGFSPLKFPSNVAEDSTVRHS